jgi:hypothetical protein
MASGASRVGARVLASVFHIARFWNGEDSIETCEEIQDHLADGASVALGDGFQHAASGRTGAWELRPAERRVTHQGDAMFLAVGDQFALDAAFAEIV